MQICGIQQQKKSQPGPWLAKWNQAIAEAEASGMTRQNAIKHVAKKQSYMRECMITEANRKER
jgi:hypothetical protein